jgi:hypothetical protein
MFLDVGRLCERPGCSEVAVSAYGFDADRLLVWLVPREPDFDGLRAGSLCRRHAEALVVPRGWTLDDRREAAPRLFRGAEPRAKTGGGRSRRRRRREPAPEQLVLPAEVESATPASWRAQFDVDDDLGGVLAAESPLLARAFRGMDRRR